MESLIGVVLVLLVVSLAGTVLGSRYFRGRLLIYRNIVTIGGIIFYGYYFFHKSMNLPDGKGVAIQVVNRHAESLDFYSIEVYDDKNTGYKVEHLGEIRPEHYRVAYLPLQGTSEFWLVAFSGKQLAYYTQHIVSNKNEDKYIEATHYLNQSTKLSTIAKKEVEHHKAENIHLAVWIVLSFLIILVNGISWKGGKK